jgi:nitroreductase
MNIINSKQLLEQLNWRYATKQFDPNRKISDQDWATIEQALLLTPSSGGIAAVEIHRGDRPKDAHEAPAGLVWPVANH